MLYRKMPQTGEELSILGFGVMRMPLNQDGTIDQARSISQIRQAIDSGVNYIDTAWSYHGGQSENLLRLALEDGYRTRVKIADKLPTWLINDRGEMDRYLDIQLERLGVDQIDYYLLHNLDGFLWDQLVKSGVADFLDKALADGRIANTGFSFHGMVEEFKRIVDAYPWVFCQIQYNFLDTENQAGTAGLKYAASKNLGVVVMEPLRGGNIALPQPPPAVAEIWKEAATTRSPVEWALRWVWDHPEVTLLLSGMNQEAHIRQNTALAGEARPNSLGRTELEIIARVAARYRELMKINCTGCGYCMPCPSGVMIPQIFETYNTMTMFGDVEAAKFYYAARTSGKLTGDEPGYASQCVECGECLEKCPQHLEIPDHLAKAAEELEDEDKAARLAEVEEYLWKKAPEN